jgi:hypothetical protein
MTPEELDELRKEASNIDTSDAVERTPAAARLRLETDGD